MKNRDLHHSTQFFKGYKIARETSLDFTGENCSGPNTVKITRFVLPRSFLVTLDLPKAHLGVLFRAAPYPIFHALQPPYHAHSPFCWSRISLGQTSRKGRPRVSSPVLITKDYWWTNHVTGVGCSFSRSTTSISEWSFDHFAKKFSGKITYIWSISAIQHLSSDSRVIKGFWWTGVFSCIGCSFSRSTTSVSCRASIFLAENFPRQIPWKWSIWGYPDLLVSPKTSDERVI